MLRSTSMVRPWMAVVAECQPFSAPGFTGMWAWSAATNLRHFSLFALIRARAASARNPF